MPRMRLLFRNFILLIDVIRGGHDVEFPDRAFSTVELVDLSRK